MKDRLAEQPVQPKPLDMILSCPACHAQHVDAPDDKGWENPPHRSHLCGACGHIWRPADVATNGVQAIKTRGTADSPLQRVLQALDGHGFKSSESQPVQPVEQPEFVSSTYDPPGLSNWLFGHDKGVRVTHKSGMFEQCHSERGFRENEAEALERLKDRLAEQPKPSL